LVGAGVEAASALGRWAGGGDAGGYANGRGAGSGPGRSLRALGANLLVGHANGHGNGHGNGNGNGHGPVGWGTNGLGFGAGNGNGHADGNGIGNGIGYHPDLDPDPDLLRLGFIGNGFTRKGGDLLLRVHQEHFADRAHLTLVCGDAPKESAGLRNVRLRCDVPWDELMSTVLPGLDLFVFPTRFDYSPYAVIEAMTAGLPVISTKVGAIPEMVQDGETGFLIEADREAALVERMDWALANRAALPAMGARGRERAADHYAAERTYPELLDLLASYTAGRS
jgi:glycosyltransferase involved in cell wall biosynthesis